MSDTRQRLDALAAAIRLVEERKSRLPLTHCPGCNALVRKKKP